ncbi:hypothetical protein KY343_03690 [Candidatus Woesearchaeota archaeon]|nr:hypothetical protein [Candidatus Woesearchaeota archaeon]
MEIKIKYPILYLIGISVLFAIYIFFIFLFITAYYHPTKSTIVQINKWGEAKLELIVLVTTIPLVLKTIFLTYKIIFNK